jgi:hypothetical protein
METFKGMLFAGVLRPSEEERPINDSLLRLIQHRSMKLSRHRFMDIVMLAPDHPEIDFALHAGNATVHRYRQFAWMKFHIA